MPIPFLVGLGIAAAGIIGAGGHLEAKETNEKAEKKQKAARELYNNAKDSLERTKSETERSILKLGYKKQNVLDTSIRQFVENFEKIKDIQMTESTGLNELSNFKFDQQDALEIRKMTHIYSSAVGSGAAGVATGVAALAAGGSLSAATVSAAAGGIAGLGAAMTPLATIAAPVVLFTGISASLKADENLEKAIEMYAEAEEASEKMKISETLCNAITKRSEMYNDLLVKLNSMFSECSGVLAGMIKKKEGRIFKKRLTGKDFSEEEKKLIGVAGALAKAVKTVIDTPIISSEGELTKESQQIYKETEKSLSEFTQKVKEIRSVDYRVKPIEATAVKTQKTHSKSTASGKAILSHARNIFAFVIGLVLATVFAGDLASIVTKDYSRFWFMEPYMANEIAFWLLICTVITVLVGRFKGTIVERLCALGSALSLVVLYMQYYRTMEQVEHYIIYSVVAFANFGILTFIFYYWKSEWRIGSYFYVLFKDLMMWPILFLVCVCWNKQKIYVPETEDFWLMITVIWLSIVALKGVVKGLNKDKK